jgi:hypothetical protein
MTSLSDLLEALEPDPWRRQVGFTPEVQAAQEALYANQDDPSQLSECLATWLQKYQPCLFGKLAARVGALEYCFLSEADLRSDEVVRKKIQASRTNWTRDAFMGKKSGFIILLLSERIANAQPSSGVLSLAQRLAYLYLEREVSTDTVHLDDVFLERPGDRRTTWMWPAGVNYFCAQADKRWWQDHRIPGGMGFSINSVGHMVKSNILAQNAEELDKLLGGPSEAWTPSKVDSLAKALDLAMRTIHGASAAVSGKATHLVPLPESDLDSVPRCPIQLPAMLTSMNHCEYAGYYHTDYTLPTEYFRADVERPAELPQRMLDFTYLFHNVPENPDHRLMGEGRPIRADVEQSDTKRHQSPGDVVQISEHPRLLAALGRTV